MNFTVGEYDYLWQPMSKRLPRFRNEREEREFWDAHNSTDYLDELEDDSDTVFVRPEGGTIEINRTIWKELVLEARRRRTTPTRLAIRWLKERLKRRG